MRSVNPSFFGPGMAAAMLVFGASGSQGEESIRERELNAALTMSRGEVAKLRDELVRSEAQRKALAQKLAATVKVSEEQFAQARETELKLQAFGVDLFAQDEKSLQQRLLKAVRDLDIAEQEIERRDDVIQELSESYLHFVTSTPAVEKKSREEALAAVDRASRALVPLDESEKEPPVLQDLDKSRVVSLESEIGLLVIDAGRDSGLRVGTPVAVLQDDQPIYSAMVVDVRDSVSGAVLQDQLAANTEVAIGDQIQLLPNQPNL